MSSETERSLDEIRLAYKSHADMQWVLALLAERDAEIERLLDATAKMEEALFEIRDYCAELHDGDTLERLAYRVVGMANGAINDYYAALAGGEGAG